MTTADIYHVKECNRRNLPENYHLILLMFMLVMYPDACFVAENNRGEIIGYAITKVKDTLDTEEQIKTDDLSGYVLSVAVDESYRNIGLGKLLLAASLHGITKVLGAHKVPFKVYLNVRPSNHSAINIYKNVFGFIQENEEASYYSDGESSFLMSRVFLPEAQ